MKEEPRVQEKPSCAWKRLCVLLLHTPLIVAQMVSVP